MTILTPLPNIYNSTSQLYQITFDGLLNVKEKTECPIHNVSFANFFIDKIIKIYNEIEFNSDNNLSDKYIDTLKKPTCISEAIPTITSTYIERLIRLTHFKTNIYIDCMTPQLLKLNIRFISLIYSNLINKCITHNNFPLSLKHSIITPIIKQLPQTTPFLTTTDLYQTYLYYQKFQKGLLPHISLNILPPIVQIIQCRVPTNLTITLKHYY